MRARSRATPIEPPGNANPVAQDYGVALFLSRPAPGPLCRASGTDRRRDGVEVMRKVVLGSQVDEQADKTPSAGADRPYAASLQARADARAPTGQARAGTAPWRGTSASRAATRPLVQRFAKGRPTATHRSSLTGRRSRIMRYNVHTIRSNIALENVDNKRGCLQIISEYQQGLVSRS